jgi:hypothetical protein
LRCADLLRGDVAAEVALGRRAGDEDAGGDRDQQRGDLRARPSPTVSSEKCWAASPNGIPMLQRRR